MKLSRNACIKVFGNFAEKRTMSTVSTKTFPRGSRQTGFTLAELLISLAILGVIATFTIPKIVNAQQDSKKRAIFKECIAAISVATVDLARDSSTYTDTYFAYKDRLNFISENYVGPLDSNNSLTLANGAKLYGFNLAITSVDKEESIVIDWNGDAPPNTVGDDIIRIVACFKSTGTCAANSRFEATTQGSKVTYNNNVTDKAMFIDLFNQ